MATIANKAISLRDEAPAHAIVTAAASEEWALGALLTVGAATGTATELAAGGASAIDLCLAAHKYPDSYYEPISDTQPATVDVFLLAGTLVEINMKGVLAQTHFGNAYDIGFTAGIPVVDVAATLGPAFVIVDLADPLNGGVVGDTNARVIGYFLDSKCFGAS